MNKINLQKIRKNLLFRIFLNSIRVLLLAVLFFSCKFTLDEPVREYFDYWSNTCKVVDLQYLSQNVYIDGVPNLSAAGEIEINLLTINPQGYRLLCKPAGSSFSFSNSTGDLAYSNYSEAVVDPTVLKIKAKLTDESEGQTITLSGCLWPENRVSFSEDQLRSFNPDLFYSATFVQNTPPDNIKDLYAPAGFFEGTHKHYITFQYPDQTLNRNKDSTYEMQYYLRDGGLHYKGTRILTLDDNRAPGDGNTFTWYFDEQEDNLTYEYVVQIIGPHGLRNTALSTDPGLGVHKLMGGTISIGSGEFNGNVDDDGFEYFELDPTSTTASYSVTPLEVGSRVTVTINGVSKPTSGTLAPGPHTIVMTAHKDNSRDVTSTKKVMVVNSLGAAKFTFTPSFNAQGKDSAGYEYIEVEKSGDKVTYNVTSDDADTTITLKKDGTEIPINGTLEEGTYTFTAIVHKTNYNDVSVDKKIKIVKSLSEPTFVFTPESNEAKPATEYEYIEVKKTTDKAHYKVTPVESGATATPSEGDLAIGEHTITVKISKPNYVDQTFTKKVKVVQELQKPTVKVFNGTTNISADTEKTEDTAYSTYSCYNLKLTEGGTISATYVVTKNNSLDTVVTKLDGATWTDNTPVTLGPHTFTFTVTRANYKEKTYTEKVYVQGILADPKISPDNGDFVSGSGNSSSDPLIYKFSYLTYDSMKLKLEPGNSASGGVSTTLTWKINGLDGTNTTGIQGIGADEKVTLEIKQKRQYCKTLTKTKYAKGTIKPINLWYRNGAAGGLKGNAQIYIKGFGGTGNYDLYGEITVKLNGVYKGTVFAYGRKEYPIRADTWQSLNGDTSERNIQITCTSTEDEIYLYMDNMRRRKKEDKGHVTGGTTRTLEDIKHGKGRYYGNDETPWTLFTGRIGDYAETALTFEVSEP